MNFIDYCIATKNYSTLDSIYDYYNKVSGQTRNIKVGDIKGDTDEVSGLMANYINEDDPKKKMEYKNKLFLAKQRTLKNLGLK